MQTGRTTGNRAPHAHRPSAARDGLRVFDRASVFVSTNGVAFTVRADNNVVGSPTAPSQICDDGAGGEGEGEGLFEEQGPALQFGVAATPTWHTALLDISSAAGSSNVVIRFAFDSIDEFANTHLGFSVDNICVSAQIAAP